MQPGIGDVTAGEGTANQKGMTERPGHGGTSVLQQRQQTGVAQLIGAQRQGSIDPGESGSAALWDVAAGGRGLALLHAGLQKALARDALKGRLSL